MINKKLISEASNGKLSSLTSISTGSGHKLNSEAAAAYEKMVKAAKADKVEWGITDSYRTFEVQDKIFDWDYFKKTKKRRKKGTSGTPVAYPGTSNHGWGAAVDLVVKYGDKVHTWLTKNASKFGFSNPFSNPRTEPWHWEHVASAKNLDSGTSVTPKIDSDNEPIDDNKPNEEEPNYEQKSTGNPIFQSMLKMMGFDESKENVKTISEDIIRIKKLMK